MRAIFFFCYFSSFFLCQHSMLVGIRYFLLRYISKIDILCFVLIYFCCCSKAKKSKKKKQTNKSVFATYPIQVIEMNVICIQKFGNYLVEKNMIAYAWIEWNEQEQEKKKNKNFASSTRTWNGYLYLYSQHVIVYNIDFAPYKVRRTSTEI